MKKLHTRTGIGFDSHAFDTQGTLVLGGIALKAHPALKGHSDGDVLLHAVIDALLGAASLGDIGDFFPDTNRAFKGISSRLLLKEVQKEILKSGWRAVHVDVTVVAERPRLSPLKETIKANLSNELNIPFSSVNIKAKTPEGLRWFKPQGGIAVWAVATVEGRGKK